MKKIITSTIMLTIVFALAGCVESTEDTLQKILDSIEIPTEVTNDLDLKTSYILNGMEANAVWHTTASSVITSQGLITVTVADQSATLIVTLSIGDVELTKQYRVIVKGSTDFLVLYAVYQTQIKLNHLEIDADLDLRTSYEQDGKTVQAVWVSSKEDILEPNGRIHPTTANVEVTLHLTLTLNRAVRQEVITVTVLQDPTTLSVNWWHTADVWTQSITGESPAPGIPSCFAGAIYRKVVSSNDYWLGIEAVLTIPEFIPDETRFDVSRPSYYLDNASIYMGGNARFESDIGLSWSIGYYDSQATTYTRSGVAFRPFWRYITQKESCTNNNCYKNANVNLFEYYYFPGDKIRMSVFSPAPGFLQMRIELLEVTTHPNYIDARSRYNLDDDFNRIFATPLFPSEGMGAMKAEFKRVNAIDQVANEGKPTINTNSVVQNAIWHEVYLYRQITGTLYKIPMTQTRSAYMTCPLGSNINGNFTNAFEISYENVNRDLGGEMITLRPNNGTGRLYNTVSYFEKDRSKKYYV